MLHRLGEIARARPLIGYFAVGGLLFALSTLVLPYGREAVIIDARTADAVLELGADRLGRDLTPEEQDATLQRHIEEEILVREAHRRGLHLQHSGARQRLLRRMRLELSQGLPEPSRPQLRAYFRTNAARYESGESLTLAHIFFEAGSSQIPPPGDVMDALEAGTDFRTLGDRFWLGPVLQRVPEDRLAGALGPDFAARVFDLEQGVWAGPIESARGTHYVLVEERHASVVAEFEQVEPTVRMEWTTEKRNEIMGHRMERIRERYEISVEGR